MHIDKALRLQVGQKVHVPPDRGDAGFTGTVTHVSPVIHEASLTEFIWVEVRGPHHKSVWPSNRLG